MISPDSAILTTENIGSSFLENNVKLAAKRTLHSLDSQVVLSWK